jgi:CubicO group peptidase (beta-lactamase class C family)
MAYSLTRREWIGLGVRTAAAVAASRFVVADSLAQSSGENYSKVFRQLDTFIESYMREMDSPGMTLVISGKDGIRRIATYGFSDLESRTAPKPTDLFQIGSISKSFVGLCLMQLRDEGKLDLKKPVLDYLPWYRIETAFAPITTHHLLTHSAGLPSGWEVFLSDPAEKHHVSNPPGEHFHYCNMGYELLGHLLWTLDGRPMPEIFRKRIFEPLGMTQSEPIIDLDTRSRTAKSYAAYQNDRPFPRQGRLSEAPAIVITTGAGSIASTPRDMGLYIQMIVNRGQGPKGRLVSDESFALWSTPHIRAEDFGPTASYGYGIAVDTLDGHKLLRHTGGMVSFMSAIQIDLDEGIGAFASVNAQQGYRPNPVVQYAIQLMRAHAANKPFPDSPPLKSPTKVEKPGDYAGTYQSSDGRKLEFAAEGDGLLLQYQGTKIPLEVNGAGADAFTAPHPAFDRFVFVFGRAEAKDPKSAVVEVGWGNEWYVNEKYSGPKEFTFPPEWKAYVGHYRNENPWIGSAHITLRKGKLMADGVVPLEAGDNGRFYLRDDPHNPEWIRFGEVLNGACMRIKFSGEDLWRVMTA